MEFCNCFLLSYTVVLDVVTFIGTVIGGLKEKLYSDEDIDTVETIMSVSVSQHIKPSHFIIQTLCHNI